MIIINPIYSVVADRVKDALAESPTMSDFSGDWVVNIVALQDSSGNGLFYTPIKFHVDESGDISGTAGKDMKSISVNGRVSSPRNNKFQNTLYKAADIRLEFSDGTTGKGIISFTDGLPISDNITFSNGNFSGQMYAQKQ